MNSYVAFGIIFLVAGTAATIPLEDLKPAFIGGCATPFGISEEEYAAFNNLQDNWDEKYKRYYECFLELGGAMKDGHFREEYLNALKVEAIMNPGEREKDELLISCIESVKGEGFEGAYEFAMCLRDTIKNQQTL